LFLGSGSALLVLFSGLRALGVGRDDEAYWTKFQEVPPISQWITGQYLYSPREVGFEPLYTVIAAIARELSDHYSLLFIIISAIAVTCTAINYAKYSKYSCLCLVLYFSHTFLLRDMNQIRAGVAAAIGLFLIAQIAQRQHFRTAVTIGVASLFHIGALAFVFPWLLSFIRWRREWLIIVVIAGALLGAASVSTHLVIALPDLGSTTDRIKAYVGSRYAYRLNLLDITNIKNLAIFAVAIIYWEAISSRVKYFRVIIIFFSIGVFWRLAFSDIAIIAARIATFFGIVEVILVSSFVFLFRNKLVGLAFVIFYAFAMLTLNLFVTGTPPYRIVGI